MSAVCGRNPNKINPRKVTIVALIRSWGSRAGVFLGTGEERRSAACLPHGSARGARGGLDGVIVYSRASTCVSAPSVCGSQNVIFMAR